MRALKKRSYFWRLLSAFFAGGFLPFVLLALVFGKISVGVLETAYKTRTIEVVFGAAEQIKKIVDEASLLALNLAESDTVLSWITNQESDSWTVSEVNRLFSSLIDSSSFVPYVISLDGSLPLTRGGIPEEYYIDLYSGWSILGELERIKPAKNERVAYGQPHLSSFSSIPLAVGVCVYEGDTIKGYVIVDIDRRLFVDRVGYPASSGGSVTELVLINNAGCILYNMTDSRLEGSFSSASLEIGGSYYSKEAIFDSFYLYGLYPVEAVRVFSEKIIRSSVLIVLCSIFVFLSMAILLSRTIAKPVHALSLTMERVAQGQLDARCILPVHKKNQDEISFLAHRFNVTLDQVNSLVDNLLAQERDLRRAEMQALQAQINPHFLFNTLNSIRSMAKLSGNSDIALMTSSLARILREGSLPGGSFTTIEESLSIARDYFSIEAMRWPGRFILEESIDPNILDAKIPRLILQPILENALVHGLEKKKGVGTVTMQGIYSAGDIILNIIDDGVGIEKEFLEKITLRLKEASEHPVESSIHDLQLPSLSQSAGIALVNTHRRLCLMFGTPYGLRISSKINEGTTISICFPFQKTEETRCTR